MKKARLEKFANIDLYPVVTSGLSVHKDPLYILDEILKTDIKIVQLREKNATKGEKFELARIYREKTREKGVLFIVNDDIDVALAVGADGVHLGNDDLPLEAARELAPDLIIGKSSHSLDEALEAEKGGADYVNVGPIYETPTKKGMKAVGIETFKVVKEHLSIPVTVMGGVCLEKIPELRAAGIDKMGLVRGIIYDDIQGDVAELYRVYRENGDA